MRYLLSLLVLALPLCAQSNDACHSAQSTYTDFTGTTSVVATSSGGQRIHVCEVEFSAATASDFVLSSAGTTNLMGALAVANYVNNNVNATVRTKPGENLVITVGTSVHVRVRIAFYQVQPN